ncbi:hypothetical protein [Helicobacter pylori]|nr:hypothetical protein [Helicobacter pylori]
MRSSKTICESGGEQNNGDLDQSVKGFLVVGGMVSKYPLIPLNNEFKVK